MSKGVFFTLLGGALFFVCVSFVLFWTTKHYREQTQNVTQENLELQQTVDQKKETYEQQLQEKLATIKSLKQEMEQARDNVETLRTRLDKSESELQEIREMELKVRRYLGLDADVEVLKEGNASHQGGFTGIDFGREEETQPSVSTEDEGQNDLVSYSLSLRESMQEVLTFLQERDKELDSMPSIMPVSNDKVWISCGYGYRMNPFTSKKEFHAAIDIAGPWKTPLIAPADGQVIRVGKNHIFGNYVRIKHARGIVTSYGHMHSVIVKKGDRVKRKDVIGYMGNTGRSTGTHVHYKVTKDGKHVNPMKYVLDRRSTSLTLN
jgi:murein DD-endopeptidase MepM/ murein hydrolase activator NlpD